ncbi:MAG: BrnT family toxin [Thermodesulfobacteriota bacterium]|nr:BrnT family toxin [Thermodesulfobacteriota bacterium]
MPLIFEWDERKASDNKKKHQVSFEEASTVFSDILSLTIPDPLHSEEENRMVIIGQSEQRLLLVVVHVERGSVIRLISARPATKHEGKFYEEDHG